MGSSRTIIEFCHNFFFDIAFRRIYLFHWSQQIREVKGVAGNCNGERIPEWLEDFTENLEIAEVLSPANTSQDSDLERPVKMASRKHSIFTHFSQDQHCEVCLRTTMTRYPS